MASMYRSDQRELGDAVVERLKSTSLNGGDAKRAAIAFRAVHKALAEATDVAAEARTLRDESLAAVSKADIALDAQIARLADRMVGASLGKRTNPFAGHGPHSPSELQGLGYSRELIEVRKLVRSIARTKPPAAIGRALDATSDVASDVQKALDRFARPQASYTRALAKRDALLPSWQKALDRLRIVSRAALVDDPSTWKALFALPGAKKKRRKRRSSAPS
jgi:hypothetical protein